MRLIIFIIIYVFSVLCWSKNHSYIGISGGFNDNISTNDDVLSYLGGQNSWIERKPATSIAISGMFLSQDVFYGFRIEGIANTYIRSNQKETVVFGSYLLSRQKYFGEHLSSAYWQIDFGLLKRIASQSLANSTGGQTETMGISARTSIGYSLPFIDNAISCEVFLQESVVGKRTTLFTGINLSLQISNFSGIILAP